MITLFGAKSNCSTMRSKAATRMRLMVDYRVSLWLFHAEPIIGHGGI
jgi:hypothetical protein